MIFSDYFMIFFSETIEKNTLPDKDTITLERKLSESSWR